MVGNDAFIRFEREYDVRKVSVVSALKAHVHPNGFARLCFCFETILLSNAVF